jgi:rhodanese-related sulfurtransferase
MKKINGKELKKKLADNIKLLDIDSIDVYRQSHILNSVNIPYNEVDLISKVVKLVPNRSDEIILCGKPYNIQELYLVAEKLEEEGYKNIYGHALGYQDWSASGVDVVELR